MNYNSNFDDSNDRIFTPTEGKEIIYAVTREGYCKSVFFVNLINNFGKMREFDKIYDKIAANTAKNIPIEMVSLLTDIIGNICPVLH